MRILSKKNFFVLRASNGGKTHFLCLSQSLCQDLGLYRKWRCQSSPRVHVRRCTSQIQQSRWTFWVTWSVLDTRRAERTPARYYLISCLHVYLHHRTGISLVLYRFFFFLLISILSQNAPFLASKCLCNLLRVTQGGLWSARWQMGPGCRPEWWALGSAVLSKTSQACTPGLPPSQASSRTTYQRFNSTEEPITSRVGALFCWLALC